MPLSSGLSAAAVGIASYLFFFKHSERHLYPFRYVQFLLLAYFAVFTAKLHYFGSSTGPALRSTTQLAICYFIGLYASLLTYRLFFNPLNKFPGPFTARLSKFDHVFRLGKKDGHHLLYNMHQKYGPYVRIGPNDLSVTDPLGVQLVLGPNSKCTKAQWYSVDVPLISMHTTRDRAAHDRRRRIWSPAFSDKALRGYEPRIQKYNDLLVQRITESLGKTHLFLGGDAPS